MMKVNENIIEAYNHARSNVESLLGSTPEDYKVFFFVDPSLYDSVLLQTANAGSPRAVISSNELDILQELKKENYVSRGTDLFYASRQPKLFMPSTKYDDSVSKKVLELRLTHALLKASVIENSKSRFPDTLQQLYRYDAIISDLFTNNVYEFVLERGSPWIWQYFQDFTASIRLLGLYEQDDFYIPPTTIRSASIFYNYLLEIKGIMQKRSKAVRNAPLYDLILHGFAEHAFEQHFNSLDESIQKKVLPHLKGSIGQPLGVIGRRFVQEHGESLPDIFENVRQLQNDYDLVSIWNRGETKNELEAVRDSLMNRALVWHRSKDSYWSDLWPLRANKFDKIANAYVGKLQRNSFKSFSNLMQDNPLVTSHGRVVLKDREVAVFAIQEDTVGQEQLVILRNHLQAKKDTFATPLPGLPDVIVFRKYSGMHVASYLGVADKQESKKYPASPYDLPLVVRAIQVTKRKDAYQSIERDDEAKIDQVNYDNLERLTEPQHRAIRYLIRQGEVIQ